MKDIILFGSTGSVGKNVLDVISHYPGMFRVRALSTGRNIDVLLDQAERFSPRVIACADENLVPELRRRAPKGTAVTGGGRSIEELAAQEDADIVFMAISGISALMPLVSAVKNGRTVALASKEPIVSAGGIISELVKENSARIIPVDSEHSAISQCIGARKPCEVRTIYLTGSGGTLLNAPLEDFDSFSVKEVLNHPKWSMGPKISVDSATLMNKGLEMIEARWLFDIPSEKIKVIVHPEAIVHSMVEFNDGTVTAVMFCPDMRFPILKALAYPEILESCFERIDFGAIGKFTFLEPDTEKFPALPLAYEALKSGGTAPAVLNSSNENAVNLFLEGKIVFTDITKITKEVLNKHKVKEAPVLEDIIASEEWAKREVLKFC
ncbi:MAG: 1-deoxy-D-xylulose-5-phosphate reductoisomerase [Candidatus Omnitrophota bacterium]